MTTYSNCMQELKELAKALKENYPSDKPAIRMGINDYTDYLCKEHKLTERQRDLLSSYACKLHPK